MAQAKTRKKVALVCASRAKREADILELWYNPDPRTQSEHIEYPEIIDVYPHQEKTVILDAELSLPADSKPRLTVTVADFLRALTEL
jgi:hypothetical protein